MDRIAAMTAFVRVVEAGTFTKAADTLNVPNATVTRLIQSLEEDLKIRLLHRTTRSVTVTPEGATYYERIVRLLAELADIESSTKQSVASPSGRVRVETAAGLAALVVVPALGEFYRSYPQVEIELGAGNRQADLVAEGIDCAIRVGEVTDQFLVARRVGEFRFATCATPEFLASHGTPEDPAGPLCAADHRPAFIPRGPAAAVPLQQGQGELRAFSGPPPGGERYERLPRRGDGGSRDHPGADLCRAHGIESTAAWSRYSTSGNPPAFL